VRPETDGCAVDRCIVGVKVDVTVQLRHLYLVSYNGEIGKIYIHRYDITSGKSRTVSHVVRRV
jgi:hypothetical protein